MPTVFTKIITGELPGRIVWSDERAAAFLTIAPLTPGHTLVVPRAEVDEWTDLEPELAGHVLGVAHTIGRALKRAFDAPRVGLIVAGFEVPHAHVHVFPATDMADFDFARAVPDVSAEELDASHRRIVDALG
ncbi:HIT family protein [Actinoplanes sp. N902-109]|uniref:HIT family protein n=1 Tax=Actinoplanes sp. (strain N902-109) TaxID=649831 RepID=UPI0003293D9D|nr:HIT family protein [Actinoplanes sp. N902-109]AGL17891.1 HIT-like (histidine triad) protein [Actinoplanes sp. N902-109]